MMSVLMGLSGLAFCLFWGEFFFFFCLMSMMMMFVVSELDVKSVFFFCEADSLSSSLILLSFWVILLSMMSSMKIKNLGLMYNKFISVKLVLMVSLVLSFYVKNLLMFYIGFEMSLIPLFLLILGWGVQPERVQAGFYMILYTLLGSLPLFFYIMMTGLEQGSLCMGLMPYLSKELSMVMYLFMIVAFLVKFPMYGVHLWLLKAHVEAPVAGSMILAGVLLKLGGYGLMRILGLWGAYLSSLEELIVSVSLWGGLMMSVMCMRQYDMKLLIAMSSVVHMGICIAGLFIFFESAYKGVLLVMLGHGLCSSGLFCLANISYERLGSRSLLINKGMLNFLPGLSLWWFLLLIVNMSSPPSLNLLGEITLIMSLLGWSKYVFIFIFGMSFFSGCYNLFLYSMSQHGVYLDTKMSFSSGLMMEYLVLSLHWVPLNMLILSVFFIV